MLTTVKKLNPNAQVIAFDLLERIRYCEKTAPEKKAEIQKELDVIQEAHSIVVEKTAVRRAEQAKELAKTKMEKAMTKKVEQSDTGRYARGARKTSQDHLLPGQLGQRGGSR